MASASLLATKFRLEAMIFCPLPGQGRINNRIRWVCLLATESGLVAMIYRLLLGR